MRKQIRWILGGKGVKELIGVLGFRFFFGGVIVPNSGSPRFVAMTHLKPWA